MLLSTFATAANAARATADSPARVADLLASEVGGPVEVNDASPGEFTPEEDVPELGLTAQESVEIVSGTLTAGDAGGWFFAVLRNGEGSHAVAWQDDGNELRTLTWTDLRSGTPTTVEESRASAAPNECEVAAGVIGGAVGGLACLPFGGVGAAVCGGVIGGAGVYVGDYVCRPNESERIATRLSCNVTECTVEGEIYTYGYIYSGDITAYAWWDRNPRNDFLLGAQPCRPACGDHSITYHYGSDFDVEYQAATYFLDPETGSTRTLRIYTVSGTLQGAPSCFVDNTKAVYVSYRVDVQNDRYLFGEDGAQKPWSYCPY